MTDLAFINVPVNLTPATIRIAVSLQEQTVTVEVPTFDVFVEPPAGNLFAIDDNSNVIKDDQGKFVIAPA